MGCGNGYQSRVTYKRACQFWKPMQLSLCKEKKKVMGSTVEVVDMYPPGK